MLVALWITAGLLTLAGLGAGLNKLLRSRAGLIALGRQFDWANDVPAPLIKLTASLEVIGALGVILPLATRIAPLLTPIAAIALAVLMIGPTVLHLRRHESPLPAVIVGLLAVAVAVLGFLAL